MGASSGGESAVNLFGLWTPGFHAALPRPVGGGVAVGVDVVVPLHPLEELEVVLETTLLETLDIDHLLDTHAFELALEDFEVVEDLKVHCGVEVHFGECVLVGVHCVHDLAHCGTVADLLDLLVVDLEQGVEPGKEFFPPHKVCSIHNTYFISHFSKIRTQRKYL